MGFVSEHSIEDVIDGTEVDLGDAEEVSEEVVEEPEVEETTEPVEETEEPTEAAVSTPWDDRIKEWGGEQEIEDAVAIARALRDEAGVEALVAEGLRHMGLDPDKVLAARGVEAPPADDEDDDPDRLLTKAEVDARFKALEDEQRTAAERFQQEQIDNVALQAVDTAIEKLDLIDDREKRMVLAFAQTHAGPAERDPAVLTAAIEAGFQEYVGALQDAAEKRVEAKARKHAKVPKAVKKGGVPGSEETPKPKDYEAAKLAARKFLAEQGDIEE